MADRLLDMDINGVEAQLGHPNYPRFAGQIFAWGQDEELSKLCVEAYNDWMVVDRPAAAAGASSRCAWCRSWDVELAAAEVRRNAARGVRAVAFSEIPYYLGYPSLHSGYWDPFFRACDEIIPFSIALNGASLDISTNSASFGIVDIDVRPFRPDTNDQHRRIVRASASCRRIFVRLSAFSLRL